MLGYALFRRFKLKKVLYTTLCFAVFFCITQIALNWYYLETQQNNPIILWWTSFMAENERLISCYDGKYSCLLTKNRKYRNGSSLVAAYLFYGSRFEPEDLPVPKNGPWALFHEESPRNSPLFLYKETQTLFEVTSTFSRFSSFPVTLQYLKNLSVLTDSKFYVSVAEKQKFARSGLAPVLYIQSDCDTPIGRDEYVKEMMKYIGVDSYGSCLRNSEFPAELLKVHALDLYNEELLKFIAKYKFVIAFENAVCDDYITEKLWRPLITGSVPIYLGSPNVEDWLPNKNSTILAKKFKTPRDLAEFIAQVNADAELYSSFLSHKIMGSVTNERLKVALAKGNYGLEGGQDHPVPAFECYVCKTAHEGIPERARSSVFDCPAPPRGNSWIHYWDLGECQSQHLRDHVENGVRYDVGQCNEM